MIFTFALKPDQDGSNRLQSYYCTAGFDIKPQLKTKGSILLGIAGIIRFSKVVHHFRKLGIIVFRSRFRTDTTRENNPSLAYGIKIMEDYQVKYTNIGNTYGRNFNMKENE